LNVSLKVCFRHRSFVFAFVDSATDEPVVLPSFYLSFFDLDRDAATAEAVCVGGGRGLVGFFGGGGGAPDVARETLSTACDGSAAVGGSLRFEATAVGGGCDNPSNRFDLVVVPCGDECGEDGPCCGSGDDGCHADQAERSVTLAFRNASAVEIRLSASPEAGPRNWGRNFLFAGASGLVGACPAPEPSPRPSADAEAREGEAHLEFFADDGQIAWSRSRERTVWYRWILRLLAGLGVAAVLCLEPLVAVLGQNVSDRHRRVHLFLAIMEQGFGACFLLELRATRPVLFLVEGAVVAGCSVASTVLVARLARAPGLKPSLDRRERALAAAIALWAALDAELVPLLPWAPSAETDAGKRLQRKHLASNSVLESITGRRPAWDIFELLCLAQIELVFHDS